MRECSRAGKWWRRIKENWVLYLFVLPAMAYYAVFHYVPIYGVQIAFQNYRIGDQFGQSEWAGFTHFVRFFKSVWFGTVLKNTLSISLLNLCIGFPVPIILALLFDEVGNTRIRKTLQTVTYAPHFISTVVLCGTVTLFLNPNTGIIGSSVNAVRELMGQNRINILNQGAAFKWIYVLSGIWQDAGWASIIYFAVLAGIDIQLVEAARVDGANKLQIIRHVDLPLLVPTIIIQLILQCGRILSVGFEKTYLLQNDTILRASEVISTYVYRSGIQGTQYSFASAVGLFNSLVNAALLITVNSISHRVDSEYGLW